MLVYCLSGVNEADVGNQRKGHPTEQHPNNCLIACCSVAAAQLGGDWHSVTTVKSLFLPKGGDTGHIDGTHHRVANVQ